MFPKTGQLQLLTWRNTLLPVSVLPPEILSRIFTLVRTSCKWPHWIWISHVCTQWRHAALSDSNLWSDINISCIGLAEAMFHRSGIASLSVHGQLSERCAFEMARLISNNLHRIRYLSISSGFVHFDQLKGFLFDGHGFSGAAPLLDKAYLNFDHGKASPCLFLLQDSFKLSPRLRTLALSNAHIIWGPHCFLHYTLTLTTLALSHVNSPPLDELLSVFRSLSGLRSVSLLDCLPVCSTADSLPWFPPVMLSCLEVFNIAGSAMDCAVVLFHLQHLASTGVFIKGKTSVDDSLIIRTYFSLIAKHFHLGLHNILEPMRAVGFEWEWENPLENYMEIRVSDQHHRLFRARLQVVCSQETPQLRNSILRKAFYAFFDTFNVSELVTVEFSGICSNLSPIALHTCCGTLPNLTMIKLDLKYSLNTIWNALGNTSLPSHALHTWDQQNIIARSFPALTTLVICQASPLLFRDIGILIQMVKSRHGCGGPIVDLKFHCLKYPDILELQEYITNPIEQT